MALGPAASTPVQHPPQHAVKNPSHLPAALAPNTPSPSPHTTRSWCEIPGQDQASAHQVKRRYRRGIRYEPSSCNKSPPFYNLTDVLTCHVHHKRISCRDWTDSEFIWTLPESWLAPPGRRLQAVPLVLHCSQRRPNAAATVPRGAPVPPAPRWTETALLPEADVSRWGTRCGCQLLYLTLNALAIIHSTGFFHFCGLLRFLAFFLQKKLSNPSLGWWKSIVSVLW